MDLTQFRVVPVIPPTDAFWKNDELMSLNAEVGLSMTRLAMLYDAMLAAAPTENVPVLIDPAELAALRRDAERYRWLRSEIEHGFWRLAEVEILDSWGNSQDNFFSGCAEMEQRIDAALSAQPAASVELLDDTSLRAAIGGIGNEVHNLACEHQNSDELSRRLSDIAGRLWTLAQQCSAEPTAASVQGEAIELIAAYARLESEADKDFGNDADECYAMGKRDGFQDAVQLYDLATGGDTGDH